MDLDRGLDSLQFMLAERDKIEEALPSSMDTFTAMNLAGFGECLKARRNVCCVAHGGVIHAQVVANLAHHDDASIEAHAYANLAQR